MARGFDNFIVPCPNCRWSLYIGPTPKDMPWIVCTKCNSAYRIHGEKLLTALTDSELADLHKNHPYLKPKPR